MAGKVTKHTNRGNNGIALANIEERVIHRPTRRLTFSVVLLSPEFRLGLMSAFEGRALVPVTVAANAAAPSVPPLPAQRASRTERVFVTFTSTKVQHNVTAMMVFILLVINLRILT